MAILPIVTAPDSRLKQKSLPVKSVDDELRKLLDDMLSTMYHEHGVGLAAIQVGVAKRVLVLDLQNNDEMERPEDFYPLFMVNPEFTWKSEEKITAKEGCLSVPEQHVEVERPSAVKIKFLDYHGKEQELETGGWLARVIQHEMDHLDGKLLIDYLSSLKKNVVLKKMQKLKKHVA